MKAKALFGASLFALFVSAAQAATTQPNPSFVGGNSSANINVLDPRNPVYAGGAKCDGVTDDQAPLAAWANAVQSGQAGYIPGICLTSQPLVFPLHNGMTIYGNGLSSEIRYIGASTTATPMSFGTVTGGCSISGLRLSNFLLSSTTLMTAGDAMVLNDACNVTYEGVAIEDNAGGYYHNWFQGLQIKGGNQIRLDHYTLTASNVAVLLSGDGTTQLTDPRFGKGVIAGALIGMNIGGQAGGVVIDGADILSNGIELRISQDFVAIPNSQITIGPETFLDATAGGLGVGLNLADPGGNNSVLTLSGTWIASSTNQCLYINAGTTWIVNWTGGSIYNCGSDGIVNYSASTIGNFVGINIGRVSGYTGFSGYGLACDVVNTNMHFADINFVSALGTAFYNANCQVASYSTPGSPNMQSNGPYVNSSAPLAAWQIDVSGQTPALIANGGNITLPVGGGRITVNNNANNDTAEYLCSAQRCVLVATTVGSFVAPTTSPPASKMSVQWNGVSNYDVYNNYGSAVYVTINMEKVRNIN